MALLDSSKKEINAKIVYYGPGLSGKTSNIQYVYKKLKPEHKGKLMTLATQTDRTLFFDFLPVELGEIKGLKVRFQIYTVPGQVFYNATRKLVLKNVDGIIFVADSQKKMLNENIESLKNLEDNLKFYSRNIGDIPFILQYNKRDLPDALPVGVLQERLNSMGAASVEAVAQKGEGVLQSLTNITKLVIQKLKASPDFAMQDMPPVQPKGHPKEYVPPARPQSRASDAPPADGVPAAIPMAAPGPSGRVTAGTRDPRSRQADPLSSAPPLDPRPISVSLADQSTELEIVELGAPEKVSPHVFKVPIVVREHGSTEHFTLNLTITIER